METGSIGSAVYLQEVDDFHLSQACINPLFTSSAGGNVPPTDASNIASSLSNANGQSPSTFTAAPEETTHVIVPKRRRARSRAPNENSAAVDVGEGTTSSSLPSNVKDSNPVTATLADCLACSGCITTAETVLIQEHHNLEKLKGVLLGQNRDFVAVVTLSAASIADLCRHLGYSEKEHFLPRLTILLHQYLKISAVLDGTLPLQYSLLTAAQEFCSAYRRQHKQKPPEDVMDVDTDDDTSNATYSISKGDSYEQQLLPSVALSSTETKYWLPPDARVEVVQSMNTTMRPQQPLPILTSSCPAITCWIEKSQHALVPHLSTVVSPMVAAAQLFWNSPSLYHLAVMPCHDKKLEASRLDFLDDLPADSADDAIEKKKKKSRRVDMVITTYELLQLLQEAIAESQGLSLQQQQHQLLPMNDLEEDHIVRRALAAIPTPSAIECVTVRQINARNTPAHLLYQEMQTWLQAWTQQSALVKQMCPYLFTTTSDVQESHHGNVVGSNHSTTVGALERRFSALGSGGYADFIFRYAARELFQFDCSGDTTDIWQPVTDPNSNTPRISARVARHRKQREYFEAVIYRDNATGQYSLGDGKNGIFGATLDADTNGMEDRTVALRFIIAYGMSTVQQVLTHFRTESGSFSNEKLVDYIECMACSNNACINGNGQIRSSERETPNDVRNRVQQTLARFDTGPLRLPLFQNAGSRRFSDQKEVDSDRNPSKTVASLFTRYHIVPPMQHTLGVSAGIAVEDTKW